MNIVIYARYSSNSQNYQSIEGQLKVCRDYAEQQGMTIIGLYVDEATTGTSDKRPNFQKMISDSSKGQFSAVLVYQFDRFARNRYDSAKYKNKLKKNEVKVISAKENISDNASGILVEGLLESMAEYYSVELSEKIKRGMDTNAAKGKGTGGNVALGYRLDENNKFIVDEVAAQIVRLVFEMYANGHSMVAICKHLNEKGYKTSKGAAFNKNSLRLMLRNKRYIGIYTYRGEETDATMPRIISDELFDEVQLLLEKNKRAPARAKAKVEYLLTTKLFCGKCKAAMTGESGTSKMKTKYYYYKCTYARKKLCTKKTVKKDYIENLVVDQCRTLLTESNIDKIAKEVVAICESEQGLMEIKRLEKLLRDIDRKKNNLIDAIAECDMDSIRKSLYEKIQTLDNEKENLEVQLAEERLQQVSISEVEVKFFLTQLKKGSINDEKYRSTLVNVFVNAIYLYDDKITLVFNSTGQPVTVNRELIEKIEDNNKEFESSYLGNDAPP